MHIDNSRPGLAACPDVPHFFADGLVRPRVSNPIMAAHGVCVYALYDPRLYGGNAEQPSRVVRWVVSAFYGRHCG